VLISPTGTGPIRPATPAEIAGVSTKGTACKTFQWAPLSTFYAVRLTADEAKNFAAATGKAVAEGDYAVLLAMHVNTKEIPFWTWQTFWWQPGADTPNNFPGNKQGQPSGLAAPWTNYAACTAYDQTTTPGGATMTVCFNPYLETDPGIPVGHHLQLHELPRRGPGGAQPDLSGPTRSRSPSSPTRPISTPSPPTPTSHGRWPRRSSRSVIPLPWGESAKKKPPPSGGGFVVSRTGKA
jgi:hypothetical protein